VLLVGFSSQRQVNDGENVSLPLKEKPKQRARKTD
tara:strand:+ start:2993 stop:3097 length:105 start_codon:yes stop_codon:yes gene_type:complete